MVDSDDVAPRHGRGPIEIHDTEDVLNQTIECRLYPTDDRVVHSFLCDLAIAKDGVLTDEWKGRKTEAVTCLRS